MTIYTAFLASIAKIWFRSFEATPVNTVFIKLPYENTVVNEPTIRFLDIIVNHNKNADLQMSNHTQRGHEQYYITDWAFPTKETYRLINNGRGRDWLFTFLATYWLTSGLGTQDAILKLTYIPPYIIVKQRWWVVFLWSFNNEQSSCYLSFLLRSYWRRWVSNVAWNLKNSSLVFHAVEISFCIFFLLSKI